MFNNTKSLHLFPRALNIFMNFRIASWQLYSSYMQQCNDGNEELQLLSF